jgi:hypothetical protein
MERDVELLRREREWFRERDEAAEQKLAAFRLHLARLLIQALQPATTAPATPHPSAPETSTRRSSGPDRA